MPIRPAPFLLAFALVAGLILGAVAAVNWLVDPFDRFGRNWTGVYISAERQMKPTEVRRVPHDAVLLGNSKMALAGTGRIPGLRMYNAAFGHATLYEIDAFARACLGKERIAVIGVDLYQFGEPPGPVLPVLRGGGWRDWLGYLFDAAGVGYSAKTLSDHRRGVPPDFRPDGSYEEAKWGDLRHPDAERARGALNKQIGELARLEPLPAAVDTLAGTVRELNRRGVAVTLFLMPLYPGTREALPALPSAAALAGLRAELARRFPGLDDQTEGPLSRADCFFPADPIHMTERWAREAVETALREGKPVVPVD